MPLPPLTYREVKAAPLTAAEIDANFRTLKDFVNAQENRVSAALNDDGSLKTPPVLRVTSTTGNDTYAGSLGITPADWTDLVGKFILLTPDTANTGGATFQPTGLGSAKEIRKHQDQALDQRDIKASRIAVLMYDGTYLQLLNPATVRKANYGVDTGVDGAVYTVGSLGAEAHEPAALYAGFEVFVKLALTNTSVTPTLAWGALAATQMRKLNAEQVAKGELRGGQILHLMYDGTYYLVLNHISGKGESLHGSAIGSSVYANNFAHGLGIKPRKYWACVVANQATGSYASGDEVKIEAVHDTGAGPAASVTADATNVRVALARAGARTIIHKDGTSRESMTEAHWNAKAYWET